MPDRVLRSVGNIFWLGTKELRGFMHDTVLIVLVIYAFSLAVISQAQSNSQELHNASIAFADEDGSPLSRRIIHAFLPPLFLPPQMIPVAGVMPALNAGRYTFVIAARADAGGPAAGQAFAEQQCSTCHVVAPRARKAARDAAPSFAAVARMSSTTDLSLRAFLQTPHGPMPDLVLSRAQIDGVVAYILSLQAAGS